MLQNNSKLKTLITSLWNTLWSGGIANPITAIEQITYLLFMKQLDDMEAKREEELSTTNKKYVSRFNGTYKPYIDESKYNVIQMESGPVYHEMMAEAKKQLAEDKKPRSKQELR